VHNLKKYKKNSGMQQFIVAQKKVGRVSKLDKLSNIKKANQCCPQYMFKKLMV